MAKIDFQKECEDCSRIEMIPLYSGSSGNSILVKVNGLNLLFDAGQSCKRIDEALFSVGADPDSLNGIFVTHSHIDHIRGIDVFVRKHSTPIYATQDTHRYIASSCKKEHNPELDVIVEEKDAIDMGKGVIVTTCPTPHDALGSVCYKVNANGKACMIMTDLGHVTDDIRMMAEGIDGILIESNYDLDMLVNGPYDYMLKKRVGGPNGHLSNTDCAEMIRHLIDTGTHRFVLGHLSENNNTPDIAFSTVTSYLKDSNYSINEDYILFVAKRYEPTPALVM